MEKEKKKRWRIVGNLVFYGLLLLLIFNGDAKAWMLQRLVDAGLFNASINKETAAKPESFFYYTADGERVSTEALRGKVVFINFWATWCPPCRAEMPSLQALYQQLKDEESLVFLFINEDEDRAKAAAYLQKHAFTFPLVTRAGTVPEALFSGTLPTTVVLDKVGRLVHRKQGLANYNTPAFIEQLKQLL